MPNYSLGIDIGGTFTDIVVHDHDSGRQWSRKVLTTHDDPARAVAAGAGGLLRAASIVVLALPDLYSAFNTSVVGVSWVITSYNLVVCVAAFVLVPFTRRLHVREVARTGLTLFTVGSVGWVDYADSSANLAASQAGVTLVPPRLDVLGRDGSVVRTLPQMGFAAGPPGPRHYHSHSSRSKRVTVGSSSRSSCRGLDMARAA